MNQARKIRRAPRGAKANSTARFDFAGMQLNGSELGAGQWIYPNNFPHGPPCIQLHTDDGSLLCDLVVAEHEDSHALGFATAVVNAFGRGELLPARQALTLALAEMRRELRWMIEAGAGADLHTPPIPGRMDRDEIRMANECLIAIRACRDVLGTMPDDDHPAWLSEVIDGNLEL